MEGSCEYIQYAVADNRQGVVLQIGGWARDQQIFTVKNQLVTKYYTRPRSWMDSLERPRQRKMDMKFGTGDGRSLYRTDSLKTAATEVAKLV
jgi:hypothetical protein